MEEARGGKWRQEEASGGKWRQVEARGGRKRQKWRLEEVGGSTSFEEVLEGGSYFKKPMEIFMITQQSPLQYHLSKYDTLT